MTIITKTRVGDLEVRAFGFEVYRRGVCVARVGQCGQEGARWEGVCVIGTCSEVTSLHARADGAVAELRRHITSAHREWL